MATSSGHRFDPSKDTAAARRVSVLRAQHARAVDSGREEKAKAVERLLREEYGVGPKPTKAETEKATADDGPAQA